MDDQTGWYSMLAELVIVPPELYYIVRMISFIFVSLAIALLIPVLALVGYDLLLWIYRLASSNPTRIDSETTPRPTGIVPDPKPIVYGQAAETAQAAE